MDGRELHGIEEARFVLGGISRATIYELLNSGELPSVVIGRRRNRRFHRDFQHDGCPLRE
jgi:excisionase family DNA binding protein